MSILEVTNLKFNYGDGELYSDLSFRLLREDHMGLVGINGCGKSTFMNLIAKNIKPDKGSIEWMNNVKYSYLDQHLKVSRSITIHEYLYGVFDNLFKREKIMEDLYASMSYIDESEYDKVLDRANQIQEELEKADFYQIKSKIGNVITGLGIDLSRMNDDLSILSGGQRSKVLLAKLLLEEPDCLLMDEPTNFLDVEHIEWLTKFLNQFTGAYIVISHDKVFLNNITNVICSLENKQITRYKGNYEYYLRESVVRKESYQKEFDNQQRLIKKTEDFIKKNIVRASTTKRAQSREKMLDKMDKLAAPTKTRSVYFDFPFSRDSSSELLHVNDLVIGYNKPLLKPISFVLKKNNIVVITGENGIGKSTLLKTLLGDIKSLGGDFKFSVNVDISYFEQEVVFDGEITPFNVIKNEYEDFDNKKIRAVLSKVGIGPDLVMKKMSTLSGGEQTKVRLCLMGLKKANLLVFDEPTNHLDYVAKEALFKAIKEFPGTVLIVSHEKEFYESLADKEIKL